MKQEAISASKGRSVAVRSCIALGVAAAFATAACGSSGGSSALSYGAGGSGNSGSGSGGSGTTSNVDNVVVTRTDLVADEAGAAAIRDQNLVNPWGIAVNPSGPIWVSDNGTGLATVYAADGTIAPLVVTIPVPAGAEGPSAPTGQVFNPTTGFGGDLFIIATEDGTIAGWKSGTAARIRVDRSGDGAIYKGVALVGSGSSATLWAANFHDGTIDVWDANYDPVSTKNGYTDPDLPKGYAPFNIAAIGDNVYVTYAKQDDNAEDDVKGDGFGYVSVFDQDGKFVKRLISQGPLNAPWGLAKAPDSFDSIGGMLLVGNFGNGWINVFDIDSGAQMAVLTDSKKKPIAIEGLWGLVFIPPADSDQSGPSTLYYTAGPSDEEHGRFGKLEAQ